MGKKISESVYILAMVAVIAIVGIFVMTLVHSKSLINSAEWQEEQNLGGEAIKQKTTSSSTSIILSNNWYVDNAANPDGDGRSWKSAWNSFQAIRWGSIRPGDTIYVSGGANGKTYMETLWVLASGIPGSPITITKGIDPGHSGNVIIDVRNLTYVAQGVYVRSAKHVIISNFKVIIDDELRTALYVRGDINEYIPELASSHITIQNMEIQNELNMGIVITTSDNIRLNNNIIKSKTGIYSYINYDNTYENNKIISNGIYPNGHPVGLIASEDTNTKILNNIILMNNLPENDPMGIKLEQSGGLTEIIGNQVYTPRLSEGASVMYGLLGINAEKELNVKNNLFVGGKNTGVIYNFDGNSLVLNVEGNSFVSMSNQSPVLLSISGLTNIRNINYNNYEVVNQSSNIKPFSYNHVLKNWYEWQELGFDLNGSFNVNPRMYGDTVTRKFSAYVVPGSTLVTVTLTKTVPPGSNYLLIEEQVPSGWTIVDSGTGTISGNRILWAEINGATSGTLTYVVKAPVYPGTNTWSGLYSLAGSTPTYLGGDRIVIVS